MSQYTTRHFLARIPENGSFLLRSTARLVVARPLMPSRFSSLPMVGRFPEMQHEGRFSLRGAAMLRPTRPLLCLSSTTTTTIMPLGPSSCSFSTAAANGAATRLATPQSSHDGAAGNGGGGGGGGGSTHERSSSSDSMIPHSVPESNANSRPSPSPDVRTTTAAHHHHHHPTPPKREQHFKRPKMASPAAAPAAAAAAPLDETTRHNGLPSLAQLQSGRPVPGCTNPPDLLKVHNDFTKGRPFFRFPPEPNGFLHIGHAKSMNLNFGGAKAHGGFCYLRYDDTNPETEEQIYIDAIEEMARWMGWVPDKVTFTSDHFQTLYDYAIVLIKKDKAYVDHSTPEMIRKQREEKTNSPWRDRPIEESLKLFEYMRQGRYAEGEATLRLKMDMQSDNPNLRDVIAYRVKYHPHPHVGDKWCIYPSYDYTHCIIDALENIDYSLCTLEFEIRRESYFWVLEQLNLFRPHVWEFSRLNVTGSLLSKRKINALVHKGIVRGFDDPRLLTLAGMRRRGYTPRSINNFVSLVGITRSMNVIDIKMLENCLREDLDEHVDRRFGVLNPVKVVIGNWKGRKDVTAANHPKREESTRVIPFTDTFYIDQSDFREVDDNPKYFGLAPGKTVGLKYTGNITCKSFDKDANGNITAIHCDVDFERAVKPKTNISWVSVDYAVPVELRLYTYLLTDDRAAIDPDFMQYINANSETIVRGAVEKDVATMPTFTTVQFERFGYFTVDQDTKPGALVMNRVISLKEDKEKAEPAPGAAPRKPQNPPKAK